MLKFGLRVLHMTLSSRFLERPLLSGRINFPVWLAPMVGLSHVALRLLVRHYTPQEAIVAWPTEMLSSWRLPREPLGSTPETLRAEGESDIVPQILGNEERPIADSVRCLEDWGAVGIDINMGCPVKKALRHNYGVALMGDAEYAREVVKMTVRHARVPVSVKLRAGLQSDREYLLKFVHGLEAAGAAWITLHPRLGHMKRRGQADWEQIRLVRESLSIPVIGNGDVQCADDVFAMNHVSGCDAVMVGRALAARPWLMWQVGEHLGFAPPSGFEGRRAPRTPIEEGEEFGRASHLYLNLLERFFDFESGFVRFKFHLRMTCGWLEFGHHLFGSSAKAKSYGDLYHALDRFFASAQRMNARTALRE
jgi:tRNA-dihydrouridine synthase B